MTLSITELRDLLSKYYEPLDTAIVAFDDSDNLIFQNKSAEKIDQGLSANTGEVKSISALLVTNEIKQGLANSGSVLYSLPGDKNDTQLDISRFKIAIKNNDIVVYSLNRKNNELSIDYANRLKSIIDSAVDGIITISSRGLIESINPAALNLFQYDESEVLGQNVKMLMPNPHRDQHDQYLRNYRNTGVKKVIGLGREVEGRRKDGTLFPFLLSISESVVSGILNYTGIIHDISDRHRAEEFARIISKEKHLNELKTRFISVASHEFRTPLSTIASSASLVKRYNTADTVDKKEKHLDRIQNMVDHLTRMLNDFLSISKIEEDKLRCVRVHLNVKELFEDVITEFRDQNSADQKLFLQFDGEAQGNVDKVMLTNVLHNLISNALKYSEAGKRVWINVESTEDNLKFSVKDEGIGIPLEEQAQVFTRFFRANNVHEIQGTGLGLNIVNKYVELMSGIIDFQSAPDEGTTFTISIPQ